MSDAVAQNNFRNRWYPVNGAPFVLSSLWLGLLMVFQRLQTSDCIHPPFRSLEGEVTILYTFRTSLNCLKRSNLTKQHAAMNYYLNVIFAASSQCFWKMLPIRINVAS